MSAKQPLKDITEQFLFESPVREPRRKAKAPLSARSKTSKAIPSSLPPSSPPPPSQDFNDDADDEDENVVPAEQPDRNEKEEVGTPLPAGSDDPFGFFAVEKQLKAERQRQAGKAVHSTPRYRAKQPSHIKTTPRSNNKRRPTTPHKQGIMKRKLADLSSDALFSPSSDSMPSSPSKSKGTIVLPVDLLAESSFRHEAPQNADSDSDVALSEMLAGPSRRVSSLRPKRRSSGSRRPKADAAGSVDKAPLSPSAVERNLEARLPKLPTRRSTRVRRKTSRAEASAPAVAPSKSARASKARTTSHRRHPRATRSAVKEDKDEKIDLSSGAEKRQEERQARIEYFKKLEEFSVEEESVYVI
ncbi:hypothetical protein FISHEDRAFT_55402 [Fistulina hepatica ATCC 64428]|uniref:Uncharacterized protein n=1 Tax=Fistulina hepatica ATCC 64428 TaxID=1128425 RepID=A0A0D7AQG0_9AGAR|nr:hypothetical protein FISHEDRAFT_55402 [Fistulina hepatica ATCC 64428]